MNLRARSCCARSGPSRVRGPISLPRPGARVPFALHWDWFTIRGKDRMTSTDPPTGGHLDAFTAREHVCYYGRALDEHLPEAVDVLADLVGHSTLPDDEVEREKEVVREEIFSYEDSPEEKVQEVLQRELWGEDPL